jgi:ADP-ribose pyrophosphatase YjhB (NUDIX family)
MTAKKKPIKRLRRRTVLVAFRLTEREWKLLSGFVAEGETVSDCARRILFSLCPSCPGSCPPVPPARSGT